MNASEIWIAPGDVPEPLHSARFVLEPLGPQHNGRDHAAWMGSIDHIRATPGFAPGDWGDDGWPYEMTAAQNLDDLAMHRSEFETGVAFAYSVLDHPDGDVIGCVYIDPDPTRAAEAAVRCWVIEAAADLDRPLADAITAWIGDAWPIASARFPGRSTTTHAQ